MVWIRIKLGIRRMEKKRRNMRRIREKRRTIVGPPERALMTALICVLARGLVPAGHMLGRNRLMNPIRH